MWWGFDDRGGFDGFASFDGLGGLVDCVQDLGVGTGSGRVGGEALAREGEGDEVCEGEERGDSVEHFEWEDADERAGLGDDGAGGEDLGRGIRGCRRWEGGTWRTYLLADLAWFGKRMGTLVADHGVEVLSVFGVFGEEVGVLLESTAGFSPVMRVKVVRHLVDWTGEMWRWGLVGVRS
jgi:hypothetical protein